MKRTLLSLLSLLLMLSMLMGAMSACTTPEETTAEATTAQKENQTTESKSEVTSGEKDTEDNVQETTDVKDESDEVTTDDSLSDSSEETESQEKETETGSDDVTVNVDKIPDKNDQFIVGSNALANGVQAYFTDASRTHYTIENLEMSMNYSRSYSYDQLVESIKNRDGATYVQNTMDVFVRMTNGDSIDTFYASQSNKSAEVNLYRFGYYYYEGLFEFQNFIPKDYEINGTQEINQKNSLKDFYDLNRGKDGSAITYVITNDADPRVMFENGFAYDTTQYDTLVIRAKAIGNTNNVQLFIKVNNLGHSTDRSVTFSLINDGEYHDYYISLMNIKGYEGTLKGIRLDPNGNVDSGIAIESMTLGKAELGNVPTALSINRHFHVYSDKMHHAIQFAVTERTEGIKEVGMLTEIPEDKVSKIILVDSKGKTYDSLDADLNWDDIVAVGFDVTEAGIFGFILPKDDIAGKLHVEIKDGVYVIEQTRTPSADGVDGVIIPSIDTTKSDGNGNYVHASGVKNNGNDFYLGQRIYTDGNHDFSEFLKETDFERNPLLEQRVNVIAEESDGASFAGYDAMRGIYILNIATPAGGFYTPYKSPNKNYKVNFNIRTDKDRDIYLMTSGSGGILECATVMDDSLMLLPIPVEVIKNFSEATGERNLYNISDPTFSEAIIWLPLRAGEKQEYTIINLYQNWGNYPLKQLSQIPFHCPYYHLSTGVTETNCILPWFGTANVGKSVSSTLPDFRSMSAPFWETQPQHNSCGQHTWLTYTDTEGKYIATESIVNTITSYGPTYAEVVWENISDDGKVKVTYTHMEMPQLDENRTYYTMEYEFLEDLTIDNFKDNFRFYKVTDNNAKGTYKKIGYLNENNECVVVDSNQDSSVVPEYVLGDNCPYFSFFMMPDWDRESTSAEGYANVAFLVYNSDFVIGGEAYEPTFLIQNQKDYVAFTLNEAGTVNFKAGDKITINAILLPWGSQELEDDPANRLNMSHATGYTEYTYSTVLEDGTLYMDKNVRDVRENTLLNPLTVTSETDKIIDSPFLPKVRSKDGKTAEFTLSGGENNVTVRIYGFNRLTSPKVEEYIEGEGWVEYVLSSHNTPDTNGYYHYYDGYQVNYDADGTYSYSFVTTMTEGAPRKFRIVADSEFKGWPQEQKPAENENLLTGYLDYEEINQLIGESPMFGTPVINEDDDGRVYSSVFIKVDNEAAKHESFATVYSANSKDTVSGQYLVIKYRVPKSNTENIGFIQIFAATETNSAGEAGNFSYSLIADGEWHVDVFDLSKSSLKFFKPDTNGNYCAQFVRVDIYNKQFYNETTHIDFEYIGLDPDLMKICELERDEFKTINLIENGKTIEIDTTTAQTYVKTYIDPTSGYTESTLAYGSIIDSINGTKVTLNNYSSAPGIRTYYGASVTNDMKISIVGWACVDGGINKYVWSADCGKTWNVFPHQESLGNADDAIINNVLGAKVQLTDTEASKKNGKFKSSTTPLIIELAEYEGQTVDIIIAAVPEADTNTLVLLYELGKVDCSYESLFVPESQYTEARVIYASQVDSVNGIANIKTANNQTGYGTYKSLVANENNTLILKGWAAIDGGVTKYVWTADGGKTWNECGGKCYEANDTIISVGQSKTGGTFASAQATKKNGGFQGDGLILDLSAYAGTGEALDIYFCAVTESNNEKVIVLYYLEDVLMPSEN